jgi:hypothetical protein
LFAVQLQLKVCVKGCVLALGCGVGCLVVVAVVTSRWHRQHRFNISFGLAVIFFYTPLIYTINGVAMLKKGFVALR